MIPFYYHVKRILEFINIPLEKLCSRSLKVYTICPRSSAPFYIVSYYIKWVTTSWTHSIYLKQEKKVYKIDIVNFPTFLRGWVTIFFFIYMASFFVQITFMYAVFFNNAQSVHNTVYLGLQIKKNPIRTIDIGGSRILKKVNIW